MRTGTNTSVSLLTVALLAVCSISSYSTHREDEDVEVEWCALGGQTDLNHPPGERRHHNQHVTTHGRTACRQVCCIKYTRVHTAVIVRIEMTRAEK